MRLLALAAVAVALSAAGCGSSTSRSSGGDPDRPALTIGAIPDQDPEQLARLYPVVAGERSRRLGVPVRYRPVTDYTASVTAFKTGDLDLVWFGGLTGVQAQRRASGIAARAGSACCSSSSSRASISRRPAPRCWPRSP